MFASTNIWECGGLPPLLPVSSHHDQVKPGKSAGAGKPHPTKNGKLPHSQMEPIRYASHAAVYSFPPQMYLIPTRKFRPSTGYPTASWYFRSKRFCTCAVAESPAATGTVVAASQRT